MSELNTLGPLLAHHPLLVVIAGPNGAGKTTFFEAHLRPAGLRYVNADRLALEFGLDARQGAAAADALRAELIRLRECFITETVFSDPVGAKLGLWASAITQGYHVVLIYIGVGSAERSDERVALRVSQGGHDVPLDRIIARYPRTLVNLETALTVCSAVLVYDNDDLRHPYRFVSRVEHGVIRTEATECPSWWRAIRDRVPRM